MTKYMSATVKREGKRNLLIAGPRAKTGREDRTMGIEIEFFGVHRNTVVNALRNAGIDVAWEGYTHRTARHWKLVYDSSVTAQGTGIGFGLELVSPPLNETEMTRQLKIVCKVLDQIGAKVDRTCGLHVHHHIDDFTVANVKNIYKLYEKHQLAIEAILPKSRRGAMNPRYCKGIDRAVMRRVLYSDTIQEISRSLDRYYTINMQSYVKYGTVEFRQHSGTIDFTKIMNWIKITQAIVATAKRKKDIKPLSESAKKSAWTREIAMIKELGLSETEQSAYFIDRKQAFKELNKQAYSRAAV